MGAVPNTTYLFSLDTTAFFMTDDPVMPPQNMQYVPIDTIRNAAMEPQEFVFALMTSKHLHDWYRDNRFCGRCGSSTRHSNRERALVCDACKNRIYPRIMPAVIVGVIHEDAILLTRYRTGYSHNALIAGFTEIGETVEETVAREVME